MVIKPDRLTYSNNIRERAMLEVRISITIIQVGKPLIIIESNLGLSCVKLSKSWRD